MKKYMTICVVALTFLMVSCEKEFGPNQVNLNVREFIENKYSDSRIIEAEKLNGILTVDIIHDGRQKDVVFNKKYEWLYTEWDLKFTEIPEAVLDAVTQSEYGSYSLDGADYVEEPTREYYRVELEKGNKEIRVAVSEQGDIL